ncbi:MAG TPA: endonuclease/exonuclease/phosphatase family protein [Verrucomicrobiales bacterium]|jgi:endonuclease/exonuclease/phosphatase family metal-dependent hydrolase|nr:endonuclease/exonuclease/phosphatase family protein [Verrucomicrobiales bacterium]
MLFVFRGACIAAGSLLFCCEGVAADGAPAEVTFVEWNLKNYLHTVTVPANPPPRATKPKPAGEVATVTRIFTTLQPDIIGVCEMGGPEDLAALQQRLKEAGIDLPHRELVEAADNERHVGLLSRFPFAARNSQAKVTYLLDDSKFPVQRGFLDVTLQITESYTLRCVGVHLKSRLEVPEASEALMRRNEAHLLRQRVDAILSGAPDTNLLVFGDFNETRDQPALHAIPGVRGESNYLTALTPVDARGEKWTYYYKEDDTYSRIDYLFASKGLSPELDPKQCRIYSGADWLSASDHRAVTAVINPVDRAKRARKPSKKATEEEPESE